MRFLFLIIFFKITTNLADNDDKNPRNPVKLTMKQGLLMNQILSFYSPDKIQDELCKNHTNEYKFGLRAFEPWALKMFDSSSKLQSGVLLGNLVEFGAYEQCVEIYHESDYGAIKGKHCTLKITPTIGLIKEILRFRNISEKRFKKINILVERSALFWSVCLPHSCKEPDITRHFEKNIEEISRGLNLTVSLEEKHCLTIDSQPSIQLKEICIMVILGSFPAMSVICGIVEASNGKESPDGIVNIFSAITNWKKIINVKESSKSSLDCLHGFRFLSACYVVTGHRYLTAMFFPLTNALDVLDWILQYPSTVIIGGTVCVDTFFLISGTLVTLSFFDYVEKFKKFNLLLFYIYRYLRITPPLAVVVLIYATLIQHLGSGPLWYDTVRASQLPCQYFWWSTLLHIQSFINPQALCILQTWYLSCEMPYYYLSPLILYPLWKAPKLGIINLVGFYVVSVAVSFYLAWKNEYEGSMPITNQLFETKYFQKHYIAPQARASTYIIGLGFGYALYRTRPIAPIKINYFFNLFMWMLSIALMLASIVGCHNFQEPEHPYNRLESAMFLAMSRSAWVTGISWMIWSCIHGYGGVVNYFLSLGVFKVLGRISYGIFLLHILLQFMKCGASKNATYFSNFTAIYDSLADLLLMIFVGFGFTIFYELPLTRLVGLLFKPQKKGSNVKIGCKN